MGLQVADSTSNLEFSRIFRYSCRFAYTPFLITALHPTFSVLKIELFELELIVAYFDRNEVRG